VQSDILRADRRDKDVLERLLRRPEDLEVRGERVCPAPAARRGLLRHVNGRTPAANCSPSLASLRTDTRWTSSGPPGWRCSAREIQIDSEQGATLTDVRDGGMEP
jgi:hypothetical protein